MIYYRVFYHGLIHGLSAYSVSQCDRKGRYICMESYWHPCQRAAVESAKAIRLVDKVYGIKSAIVGGVGCS